MGLFQWVKKTEGSKPKIRSKKDFITFVNQKSSDGKLASVLAEIFERNGRDAFVYVKKGGAGNPYEVEYQKQVLDMSQDIARQKFEEFKKLMSVTQSERQKFFYKEKFANEFGLAATLFINLASEDEFNAKRDLVVQICAELDSRR